MKQRFEHDLTPIKYEGAEPAHSDFAGMRDEMRRRELEGWELVTAEVDDSSWTLFWKRPVAGIG